MAQRKLTWKPWWLLDRFGINIFAKHISWFLVHVFHICNFMFGNLGRYNVIRHNWLRSKILQITFFRDVRFRVITVIVIRLVEAFSFLIFWQRNHLAAAPGDSSGGNNDLCGSEKKKVKVEQFGWSLTPVGVGGAMMSVQIFRVISWSGANS